jgi:hypothetical protein
MSDWLPYLMGFAQHAATKSKDSTQVGAVLVAERRCALVSSWSTDAPAVQGRFAPLRGFVLEPPRLTAGSGFHRAAATPEHLRCSNHGALRWISAIH